MYIEMTSPRVDVMGSPRLVVLITSKKPFKRACPPTIGYWRKDTLKVAGVDTERFTAHSTRDASTSWALVRGVPIPEILKMAI